MTADSSGCDSALLSALSHPRNREIVLEFEDRVLQFLATDIEALVFPLTLSGYQRLLAHRTAQHHGLQTETIADDGEDHGKIRATRLQGFSEEQKEKLSDVPVEVTPVEDQREPPKALKKKNGPERPRARDNHHIDGHRGPVERPHKPFIERNLNYVRERERIFEGFNDNPDQIRPGLRNGSDGAGSTDLGKATFRNREQELRDPEFQRFRGPGFGGTMDHRFRPPNMPGEEMEHMMHMMQGMSFGPGPENGGMTYIQHPNAMAMGPPYNAMGPHPLNYGYQGPMMQQIPQGMGVYGSAGMPYGYSQVQYPPAAYSQQFMQPYPYPVQMRPTNGLMQPYAGQQMGQNMMPYYQTFVQQGYPMPGPSAQGGRPGFPGPPRPRPAYPSAPLPRNGSGGYNRKPTPGITRPSKPDANAAPKNGSEGNTAPVTSPSATTAPADASASQTQETEPVQAEAGQKKVDTSQA